MIQMSVGRLAGSTVVAAWLGVASSTVGAQAASPAGQGAAPAAAPRTAGETFKNVHILKDVPADQLLPTMQFIAASLGVECNFCHIQGAFEKDDRKEKQTARKMMQMMMEINKSNFDGDRNVTCFSCHRGAPAPLTIPAVAGEDARPEPEGTPPPAPPLPTADQLLDRYVQAVGGAAALMKITSRVQKGQITSFGRLAPIEVYAKAPNKRMSVTRSPRGESVTAYDGSGGWLTGREGPHPMTAAESSAARLDADLYLPLHIKQLFSAFRVQPAEKVGDRDATLLVAANEGKPPVHFYFDSQSGLLLRQVRYTETALGYNPAQIDYADFRDVDGVKVPFRWTLARPNGRFTIQVETTEQNVAIDDAKFVMPTPPTPPPVAQAQPAPPK